MHFWTPSTLGKYGRSINEEAQAIDGLLWHLNVYGTSDDKKRAELIKSMQRRASTLRREIEQLRELDLDIIFNALEEEIQA